MIRTQEQAIVALAERSVDTRRQLRQQNLQRRNQVTDLYGVVFHAQADANNSAKFYISVSPDLAYYERFEFKLGITPYLANVTGGTTNTSVTVQDTSLSVSGDSISPNPHGHNSPAHGHTVIKGISSTNVSATEFYIKMSDPNGNWNIQLTDYLKEQHGGDWIEGEGIWPKYELEDDDPDNFYDLLDVASVMEGGGETTKRERLLSPGFKLLEVSGNGFFAVDMYLYLKYPHTNR